MIVKPELSEQLEELCRTTGEKLAVDHTYKSTSSIGVTINTKWVHFFFLDIN
jgi:hypothetical protein